MSAATVLLSSFLLALLKSGASSFSTAPGRPTFSKPPLFPHVADPSSRYPCLRARRRKSPQHSRRTCTQLSQQRSTANEPSVPIPPPPTLNPVPLPAMLAGGLFLFASSVPRSQKRLASRLLSLSERALRADPTVAMELGMGVEAGGVYASSSGRALYGGRDVAQLVVQFQINGGNAWAQGVAYGIGDGDDATLLSLEVANMDAVLNGVSFVVPVVLPEGGCNEIQENE